MKKFRVLLVYVNSMMDNLIPLNISYLTACLKNKGIEARLFDTTFYRTAPKSSDEARVEMLQVKPFDLTKFGIDYKNSDYIDDFRKLVADFKPDLLGFSVVEPTYALSSKLLESIKDIKGESKVIFGGVYSVFAFERIMNNELVDMVCYGEGEKTILEVCEALSTKGDLRNIDNLAVKIDGQVHYGPKASPIDINELPYLDASLFEKERFYKPIGGKVSKMLPVEFARGCPYRCTYCASPAIAEGYKGHGRWFREKSVKKIKNEIEHYIKEHNIEYFYFISESFLSMREDLFNEFVEFYSSIRIPFWFNTRIETITPDKLKKLEKINCNRMSIGLESGSEFVRRNLLRRNYSNDYFVEKFKMLSDYKIAVSVNNIIGFPDETREQIMETIELNRKINAESFGAYIFQPFQGTALRKYCVEKGYIPGDYVAGDNHVDFGLKMPHISGDEVVGLQRTFALYARLPKEYYDKIRIAERFDERGNDMFGELAGLYYKKYA